MIISVLKMINGCLLSTKQRNFIFEKVLEEKRYLVPFTIKGKYNKWLFLLSANYQTWVQSDMPPCSCAI